MEIRKIERDGFCRGCDKLVSKGDVIFYVYSSRNRGQSIIFCIECTTKIGEMVGEAQSRQFS